MNRPIAPNEDRCVQVNVTPDYPSNRARGKHGGERCRLRGRQVVDGRWLCARHAQMATGERQNCRAVPFATKLALAEAIMGYRRTMRIAPGEPWVRQWPGAPSYAQLAARFGVSTYLVGIVSEAVRQIERHAAQARERAGAA